MRTGFKVFANNLNSLQVELIIRAAQRQAFIESLEYRCVMFRFWSN